TANAAAPSNGRSVYRPTAAWSCRSNDRLAAELAAEGGQQARAGLWIGIGIQRAAHVAVLHPHEPNRQHRRGWLLISHCPRCVPLTIRHERPTPCGRDHDDIAERGVASGPECEADTA